MSTERKAYVALVAIAFLAVVQNCWYWSQLPPKVATHFNLEGEADSWMPKGPATIMMIALQLGLPLFLVGITALTSRLPTSLINLPNREYWLHPSRCQQSLAYVRAVISWLAVAVAIHVMAINHLSFLANRNQTKLNTIGVAISMIFVFVAVIGLIGNLLWHFRLPENTDITKPSRRP
jgi:uncharacterized membrane protein